MRMVNAKRVFFCRNIISENKIQLKIPIPDSGDRSDRVVRFSVRLGKDKMLLRLYKISNTLKYGQLR